MEKDDRVIRKVVGKLIEVLHGEYSDTRDLAVVQLAILGSKAVPHICAFLKKEAELESDFIKFHKMWCETDKEHWKFHEAKLKLARKHEFFDVTRASRERERKHPVLGAHVQRIEKLEKAKSDFLQKFKKKWGWCIGEDGSSWSFYSDRKEPPWLPKRRQAVNRALEALAIIGDPKAIPTLMKIPIYNYDPPPEQWEKVSAFEKVKETIDEIQSI